MWTVELAGAGYADHKPPYDFKHGWVPVSGAAVKTTVRRKYADIKSPDDLDPEDRNKLPNSLKFPLPHQMATWKDKAIEALEFHEDNPNPKNLPLADGMYAPKPGQTGQQYRDSVREYLAKNPQGYVHQPVAAAKPPAKRAPKKAAPKRSAAKASGDLDKDWASATKSSKRTEAETEAIHDWQNGTISPGTGDDEYGEEQGSFGANGPVHLYQIANDILRGTNEHDLSEFDEDDMGQVDAMIDSMASALAKSVTTRDVTVYRGVSKLVDVQVGDTMTDKGWQSTSLNEEIAGAFLGGGIGGQKATKASRVLVITIPKGKHALAIRERPEYEAITGNKHEITLGPGTPLKVTKIEGNRVHVEVQ